MFPPDCDMVIHLKWKFSLFLETTPEIQGENVEAYPDLLPEGAQKAKVVSSFSFWVPGRKAPCSLPAEQCVHRGHIRQARWGTPPGSRVCKNTKSRWHGQEKCTGPRKQNKANRNLLPCGTPGRSFLSYRSFLENTPSTCWSSSGKLSPSLSQQPFRLNFSSK